MKLQFGLLWIENSYSEQEEAEIRSGAADAGFELKIKNSTNGSDLEDLAEYQRKFHAFDLVLLDLNLDDGVKGDELAPKVRQLFRTIPILFYSGSVAEAGLRDRMAKDKIEGVFCANRENFVARTRELIQDYAHTLNRLSGMRGLSMEVVAEVDNICRQSILKLAEGGLEKEASSFLDKAITNQYTKTLKGFPELGSLRERIDHPAADSMKCFKTFREMIRQHLKALPNGDKKDDLQALMLRTKKYLVEVIEVRNVLGHALEERTEAGWTILDRDGNRYMTVDDFPKYRSSFLMHLRAMREFADLL